MIPGANKKRVLVGELHYSSCHVKYLLVPWPIEDVIVFECDNWPPPPCSQLRRSLQCCSLLNYYQWVWRDTCSFFPLTAFFFWQRLPLSLSNTHAHDSSPIFHPMWIWQMWKKQNKRKKRTRSILCKRQWTRSMLLHEYSRLMEIPLECRHRSTYWHAWMHLWAGHKETQMLLCGHRN